VWAEHIGELRCPACRGELCSAVQAGWIDSGELLCPGCGQRFQISAGVPRLFCGAAAGSIAVDPRTRESFSFEWLRYPVTTPEEDLFTLLALTGVQPELYKQVRYSNLFAHQPTTQDLAACDASAFARGRVVELGCGMGKYVAVVAKGGATVAVGLDASAAVERAATLCREHRNALIVQGDIFRPPLSGGYDLAYSVGVLHHTPDARAAFLCAASLVRDGGELAVWLYPRSPGLPSRAVEWYHDRVARALLSRLPHRTLERICGWLGRLTVVKSRWRARGGGWRQLARLLNVLAVGEHHDPGVAAFLNFDWYSPPFRSRHTVDELGLWYAEAGFDSLRVLPEPVSAIGRRKVMAPPPPGTASIGPAGGKPVPAFPGC